MLFPQTIATHQKGMREWDLTQVVHCLNNNIHCDVRQYQKTAVCARADVCHKFPRGPSGVGSRKRANAHTESAWERAKPIHRKKSKNTVSQQGRVHISNDVRDFAHEWNVSHWSTGLHNRTLLDQRVTVVRLVFDGISGWLNQHKRQHCWMDDMSQR